VSGPERDYRAALSEPPGLGGQLHVALCSTKASFSAPQGGIAHDLRDLVGGAGRSELVESGFFRRQGVDALMAEYGANSTAPLELWCRWTCYPGVRL
jgi:hypothetical protein